MVPWVALVRARWFKRESLLKWRVHFSIVVIFNSLFDLIISCTKSHCFLLTISPTIYSTNFLSHKSFEYSGWEGPLRGLLERTILRKIWNKCGRCESWYQVWGMWPQAPFSHTFTGKLYVNVVGTLATSINALRILLNAMINYWVEFNNEGEIFCTVTKDSCLPAGF